MENRSVRHENRKHSPPYRQSPTDTLPGDNCAARQAAREEFISENLLSRAELHSLVQFFELLDRWDREVVQ